MIFFQPHIGQHYQQAPLFGKRIMVLGESHYCGDGCVDCGSLCHPECARFTSKVIADYLNPNNEREGWMNTYLKFERSLVGHETDHAESQHIWDNIAFYNYLQVAMGGPRKAGRREQYEAAVEPFFEVLKQLRPDLLIVWGMRLWNALPGGKPWTNAPEIEVQGFKVSNGFYQLDDGHKVKTFPVYHPSTGYDWAYWYRVIYRLSNC